MGFPPPGKNGLLHYHEFTGEQTFCTRNKAGFFQKWAAGLNGRFCLYIHETHLVDVKYCEDTRPKNQLEASKQQHRDLCRDLSRDSAQVTLHTIMFGVGGVIYTSHTLEPLKEL
eukprot:1146259-Pelagomonas_calceolata.AAC.4